MTDSTKTFPVLLLDIKRGVDHIPFEALEHELPILKAIHLEENVQVFDQEYGEVELPNDADAELRRLRAKYDDKNDRIVFQIYRNPKDVADATGLKVTGSSTTVQQSAQIVNDKPAKAKAAKAS
ncbi:hypothetical protein [Pseudoxanthomonas sp. X-1]|uniref:hypothetical protein n=1 Tax=Pseudoxanthomonas sp. X-1 TaxID=2571115 RepID=UPI00110BAFA4|nr:hypothetical protein [Pseudoxanthomonas sp. X-1]TMN18473.1 hypothetical protein FF950_14415 [Pseudoxanthomonas sp. X-1]UAY76025.1 hypothetical protein LAJ50_07260 [Pseudoxanthomonas sp. X-1]